MTDPVTLFENSASDGIVFLVDGDAIAVATDDHHSQLVSLHSIQRHGTLNKRHREIARAVRAAHRAIERARQFGKAGHDR